MPQRKWGLIMDFVRCGTCNRILPYKTNRPGICATCRGKRDRKEKKPPICYLTKNKIKHRAEIEFAKGYTSSQNLIYQPALFRFNGTSYQPDFYDREMDLFFEIVGSRQAFHQSESKIEQFKLNYPHIKLEIIFDYSRG